jgi:hypothetical protein
MSMKLSRTTLLRTAMALTAIAATVVALATRAASPVADEKIAVAKASVQLAGGSGAPEFAALEMASARDKLAWAEKADADRDLLQAAQLADQADIDAQLAEAIAQLERSHKAATEFDASMQALRAESLRTSPPAQ